jgi:hypothetical protein
VRRNAKIQSNFQILAPLNSRPKSLMFSGRTKGEKKENFAGPTAIRTRGLLQD